MPLWSNSPHWILGKVFLGVFFCVLLKKLNCTRLLLQFPNTNWNSPFQGGSHNTNCDVFNSVLQGRRAICIHRKWVHTIVILKVIVNVEDLLVRNPFRIQSERSILRNRTHFPGWIKHQTVLCSTRSSTHCLNRSTIMAFNPKEAEGHMGVTGSWEEDPRLLIMKSSSFIKQMYQKCDYLLLSSFLCHCELNISILNCWTDKKKQAATWKLKI